MGINPRVGTRTHGEPKTPDGLTAQGYAEGTNALLWNRNGNKPNTIFVIEAQIGDAPGFVQVGSTGATRFRHTGQTPGVRVLYRHRRAAQWQKQCAECHGKRV